MVHLQPIAEVLDAGSFAELPVEQRPKGQSVEEVLLHRGATSSACGRSWWIRVRSAAAGT